MSSLERGLKVGLHRGAQVVLVNPHQPTATVCVGATTSGRAVDRETQFPWACASKLPGVLALAALISGGQLDFDTALGEVLPELQGTRLGRTSLSAVVTHQTGIALEAGYEPATEPASTTLQRLVEHLEAAPSGQVPAGPAYLIWSHWFLVGQVVERLTGTTYADHLDKTILRPLGAERTVPAPAAVDHSNAVTFEMGHGEAAQENPLDQGEAGTVCVPGYSFCGPAADLAAVLGPFIDPSRCDLLEISHSTMASICRTRRSGVVDAHLGWAPDWGFGVATDPKMWRGYDGGARLVGHVGVGGSAVAVADEARRRITVALFGRSVAAFPATGRSMMTLQRAGAWHAAAERCAGDDGRE